MNDEDVKKFMKDHSDLFDRLAHGVLCPACGKLAMPPLVNLGEKFHWGEGHPECLIQKDIQ